MGRPIDLDPAEEDRLVQYLVTKFACRQADEYRALLGRSVLDDVESQRRPAPGV
jgi:hypothetical protein